jgi:hypothetical protein
MERGRMLLVGGWSYAGAFVAAATFFDAQWDVDQPPYLVAIAAFAAAIGISAVAVIVSAFVGRANEGPAHGTSATNPTLALVTLLLAPIAAYAALMAGPQGQCAAGDWFQHAAGDDAPCEVPASSSWALAAAALGVALVISVRAWRPRTA